MPDGDGQNGTGGMPGANGSGQGTPGQPNSQPESWDTVLAGLPATAQQLFASHVEGLKNSLVQSRQERDAQAERVRVMIKALDGKEPESVRKELEQMQAELAATATKAAFYEEAGKPGVGCEDPRLAYLVAMDGQLFTRTGSPDWEKIKAAAPLLFRKAPVQSANAGAGSNSQAPGKATMNDWIRSQVS